MTISTAMVSAHCWNMRPVHRTVPNSLVSLTTTGDGRFALTLQMNQAGRRDPSDRAVGDSSTELMPAQDFPALIHQSWRWDQTPTYQSDPGQ